jgi:hypothetical protein
MAFFIIRVLIAALGLWCATEWVDGITVSTPTTLILAALLLGVVNAIVRPIVILLTLPATLLTLGLFPARSERRDARTRRRLSAGILDRWLLARILGRDPHQHRELDRRRAVQARKA